MGTVRKGRSHCIPFIGNVPGCGVGEDAATLSLGEKDWAGREGLLGGGPVWIGPSAIREESGRTTAQGTAPDEGARAGKGLEGASPAILRVSAGEGDAAHWIMAAKEKPARSRWGRKVILKSGPPRA